MDDVVYGMQDVRISDADRLAVTSFSASTAKLAANDVSLFPDRQRVPGIWRNRRYSAGDASDGYAKGEAVWINTEDIDRFVVAYERVIRQCIETDAELSAEMARLDRIGDRNALLAFYKEVVRGYDGREPLFYLGDLTKPVQIRISLVDGNRLPPTDSNVRSERNPGGTWRDFFEASTDAQLEEQIRACFDETSGSRT